MQKISTQELKQKIDNKEKFYLVDVLAAESYAAHHIPGAVSVPGGADFPAQLDEKLQVAKDAEIVVYCSSETCMASVRSGEALEKAGYTNVKHYSAGLAGWQNAGLAFGNNS